MKELTQDNSFLMQKIKKKFRFSGEGDTYIQAINWRIMVLEIVTQNAIEGGRLRE